MFIHGTRPSDHPSPVSVPIAHSACRVGGKEEAGYYRKEFLVVE